MSINGVYLPGWEYNRVLARNPLARRNSALPGAAFWNGGALFWMFEHVYCTSDSLVNEAYAAERLGWATSRAFVELSDSLGPEGPILKPIDWEKGLGEDVARSLKGAHKKLREEYPDRAVRKLIDEGRDGELERINHRLIQPIATANGAVVAGSPGGLSQWAFPVGGQAAGPAQPAALDDLLKAIADPITSRRTGMKLMTPQVRWPAHVQEAQTRAQNESEKPYISDLAAGEGAYDGPNGYVPYIDNARRSAADYLLADTLLAADWRENRDNLKRLREVAHRYLWPKLHDEWIPALLAGDGEARKDVPVRAAEVLAKSHFVDLLTVRSAFMFAAFDFAYGVAEHAGAPVTPLSYFGLGTAAVGAFEAAAAMWTPGLVPLAVFYQNASKTLDHPRPKS
jgi:hypothetical protein